ncbi:MAG TPA: MFS transporter [Pseudolysinimonas sp.]|nr:MFS transporter [Pseudolysinimonas sp.]
MSVVKGKVVDVARSNVGLRSERGPLLLAIMVSTGLVAIDATILATAVPSIVKDLGDFSAFPWLFSIYLLAQAVSVPVYSKLSDVLGRKPLLLFGIGLFLLGSILCGFAWSMPALIAFRLIQGLGAGAVLPTAMTMIGDIYTIAERARVQGYLASVWAISSVVGPTLGGVFSQSIGWPWIFFVNIPLGLVASFLIMRNFHEKVTKRTHRIDFAGAALLTSSLTLLILGLLEGGQAWAWNSPVSFAIFGAGIVLFVAFLLVERRAAEPILPLWAFTRPLLLTTTLLAFCVGAMLIGLTSYIPTYLDGSIHTAPIVAGLALASLTVGWPVGATLSGRIYLRIGFRSTILIGAACVIAGATLLVIIAATPSVPLIAGVVFVVGFGLGLSTSPALVAAQSSVSWNERGVVTGTNVFARNVGSAVGIAAMGAIANAIFATFPRGESDPHAVVSAATAVFTAALVAAVLAGVAAIVMPKTPVPHGDMRSGSIETAAP